MTGKTLKLNLEVGLAELFTELGWLRMMLMTFLFPWQLKGQCQVQLQLHSQMVQPVPFRDSVGDVYGAGEVEFAEEVCVLLVNVFVQCACTVTFAATVAAIAGAVSIALQLGVVAPDVPTVAMEKVVAVVLMRIGEVESAVGVFVACP